MIKNRVIIKYWPKRQFKQDLKTVKPSSGLDWFRTLFTSEKRYKRQLVIDGIRTSKLEVFWSLEGRASILVISKGDVVAIVRYRYIDFGSMRIKTKRKRWEFLGDISLDIEFEFPKKKLYRDNVVVGELTSDSSSVQLDYDEAVINEVLALCILSSEILESEMTTM